VWFPGMHADVGGGYPDDGLSFVPLCWMIDEARKDDGLHFEEAIVNTYRALASPTGRLYDSREGLGGALWRYQPRNVQFLMDNNNDKVPLAERVTPLVHHSTITRMTYGNDGYAPKSLPFKISILLPNDRRVGFDKNEVAAEVAHTADDETKSVLTDLKALIETTTAQAERGYRFSLVLDTIWWRRVVYFATLGLALVALVFPVVYALLDWTDKTAAKFNQITGGTVHWLVNLVKGFIPSYASPWVDAISADPPLAINIVVLFGLSLLVSKVLELHIKDRARAAWNVQPKVAGDPIKRMELAGQRGGVAWVGIICAFVAFYSYLNGNWRSLAAAVIGAALSAAVFIRRGRGTNTIDPKHPPLLLGFARMTRNSARAVAAYRWLAKTALPAAFILIVAWIALWTANLGLYNLQSTNGNFCRATIGPKENNKEELALFAQHDRVGIASIDIANPCAPTGLWLVAGRQYRIQIEPGKREDAWFDKGIPADVTGFSSSGIQSIAVLWRRWWREDWFRPVARVGEIGNYEYPLKPVSPLPKVDFSACWPKPVGFWQSISDRLHAIGSDDTRSPAPLAQRLEELACEAQQKIMRNEALISDVTPDSTGELFIYVNDAVFFWDGRDQRFYQNNTGKAKVTVTRLQAPGVIDAARDPTLGSPK
ncbi:MAG TPA: DUF2235 domain-containing protein, partial [Xanthobacteraceae bacterium]|nr:DUF2235 domain-containing protein [Xanthobacteraceae bacterium]